MRSLLFLLSLPLLFSFTFAPMQQSIQLHKDQKFTRFMVDNQSSETIPVTFNVQLRKQNIDGSENNEKTSDLSIFPPQMILKAGEKKAVRVSYKGDEKFSQERAYRVIAQQVPVNLDKDKEKGGIKMLLKYQNALYVVDKEYQSDLQLISFKNAKDKLKVTLLNKGSKHQYLHNVKIYFTKDNKKISLPEKELSKLEGQNILAKTKREFSFKALKGLESGFQGHISFENK